VPAQQVPRLHTHEHTVILLLLSHLIKNGRKITVAVKTHAPRLCRDQCNGHRGHRAARLVGKICQCLSGQYGTHYHRSDWPSVRCGNPRKGGHRARAMDLVREPPDLQSCPAPWSQLRSSCWSPRLRPSPRAFDSPAVVLLAAVPPDCELPPCHIAACLGQRPRRPRLFGRLDTSCDQGVVTPPPILRERTIVVSRRAYVTTPLVGPPMPPPFTHGAPDFTTGRR
jgi:hypothetical protein